MEPQRPTLASHVAKSPMPEAWKQHIAVPIGTDDSCTLECYESLMELPVACKVDHGFACCCQKTDTELVHEYLRQLYDDRSKNARLNKDTLRIFQELIRDLCEDFDAVVEGGFAMPDNVPDPRTEAESEDEDKLEGQSAGKPEEAGE